MLYDGSVPKLMETLECSREVAATFYNLHKKRMPEFSAWRREQKRLCRRQGYVETLLGFRRDLPEIQSNNKALRSRGERIAINTPIQGTSAHIIQTAMSKINRAMKRRSLPARMLLQVHDELVFSCLEEEVPALVELARGIMETAYPLSLPTPVDVEVGRSWGEVKDYVEWREEVGV